MIQLGFYLFARLELFIQFLNLLNFWLFKDIFMNNILIFTTPGKFIYFDL